MNLSSFFKRKGQQKPIETPTENAPAISADTTVPQSQEDSEQAVKRPVFNSKTPDIKLLCAYYERTASLLGFEPRSIGPASLHERLLQNICAPEWQHYMSSGEMDTFLIHINEEAERLQEKEEVDGPVICAMVPSDAMAAFFCVLPSTIPSPITQELIMSSITAREIDPRYIRSEDIDRIVENEDYFRIFSVAQGISPTDGENGTVIDHYPREWNPPVRGEDDDDNNIKSLKFVTPINKGDVICDIIPPTSGEEGSNIYGKPVAPKPGKAANVPKGRNTVLTEDKSALIADADGHIIYEHHEFQVNHTLSIPGSLDGSAGTLNFLGNIEVNGNIAQGVHLNASGYIKVYGTAEGVTLTSDGHITLKNGINGNNSGIIKTGEYIKSQFLENATVHCSQDVLTESIVNCHIVCGQSVDVTRGRGIIMGGTIYAIKSVSAKMIGKPSGIVTEFFLGTKPDTDDTQLEQLKEQQKEMQATLDNLQRNLDYFQKKGAAEQNKEMFEQLCTQADLYVEKLEDLKKQILSLSSSGISLDECFVQAKQIYPNTRIHIGSSTFQVEDMETNCRFYYSTEQREIIKGAMF